MQALPIVSIIVPSLAAFLPVIHKGRVPRAALASALAAAFALVVFTAYRGGARVVLWRFHPLLDVAVGVDGPAKLFSILFALLAAFVGLYALAYMKDAQREGRFFKYFYLTYAGMLGTCYARNLFTFILFFEMVTLCSLPLVLHDEVPAAWRAGIRYIGFSIFGAALALLLLFALAGLGIEAGFTNGGLLLSVPEAQRPAFLTLGFLAIVGLCAKAGMFPLHAWLPEAHPVAPSPASAFLSGAILKCGALGAFRVIYSIVGADFLRDTWVQTALIALSLASIFIGSTLAMFEKKLKRRFAYSSLSQLSYALLGLFLLSESGVAGAMLQMIAHALAKTTLFLWTGIVLKANGATTIDELRGVGRKMPTATACFIVAALSLCGFPPMGGFLSKFMLAQSSLASPFPGMWGVAMLIISSLLTAGYLLPIAAKLLFPGPEEQADARLPSAPMLVPAPVFAALLLGMGLFAGPVTRSITALLQGLGL